MALTHNYCDAVATGAGNDYAGTTFTDGSWDEGSLTLTKTGAFALTIAGQKFYLDDNGSGDVTTALYTVDTVTDDDNVVMTASIRSGGVDPTDVVCTLHDGTVSLPWSTIQKAVDVAAGAAGGNQINLKAGTAFVLTTDVVWTNYSATNGPDNPLTFRGYTTSADDGGIAEIDGNNAAAQTFSSTSFPTDTEFIHLKMHNTTGDVLRTASTGSVIECELYNGGADQTLYSSGIESLIVRNHVHTGTSGAYGIRHTSSTLVTWNYVTGHDDNCIMNNGQSCKIYANLVEGGGGHGISIGSDSNVCVNNTIVGDGTASTFGIDVPAGSQDSVIMNNIIKDWDGTSNIGINYTAGSVQVFVGHNHFHNNTVDEGGTEELQGLDLRANDQTTDPTFVNASSQDYRVGTNCKAKGYPSLFLGSATTSFVDTGCAQREEVAVGGLSIPIAMHHYKQLMGAN